MASLICQRRHIPAHRWSSIRHVVFYVFSFLHYRCRGLLAVNVVVFPSSSTSSWSSFHHPLHCTTGECRVELFDDDARFTSFGDSESKASGSQFRTAFNSMLVPIIVSHCQNVIVNVVTISSTYTWIIDVVAFSTSSFFLGRRCRRLRIVNLISVGDTLSRTSSLVATTSLSRQRFHIVNKSLSSSVVLLVRRCSTDRRRYCR